MAVVVAVAERAVTAREREVTLVASEAFEQPELRISVAAAALTVSKQRRISYMTSNKCR